MQELTIYNCFFPFYSHSSEHHTVLCQNPPEWWDWQSEIPEWLWEKGLMVSLNIGVCGQEYCQEDWQITET